MTNHLTITDRETALKQTLAGVSPNQTVINVTLPGDRESTLFNRHDNYTNKPGGWVHFAARVDSRVVVPMSAIVDAGATVVVDGRLADGQYVAPNEVVVALQ